MSPTVFSLRSRPAASCWKPTTRAQARNRANARAFVLNDATSDKAGRRLENKARQRRYCVTALAGRWWQEILPLRQPPLRMTSRGASGVILNEAQCSEESRCLWLCNALPGLGERLRK